MYLRVIGIIINGYEYTNILGNKFKTDHITLVRQKGAKVVMITYVENDIRKENLLEAIASNENISYLVSDIENGVLDIEIVVDPTVINEVKKKTYEKFGPQAGIPRMILLSRE